MKFFPFNTRIAMLNEAGLPNTFIMCFPEKS